MTGIKELEKELAELKKRKAKLSSEDKLKLRKKVLKSEIRNIKYATPLNIVKRFKKSASNVSKNFQQQRKKKKGLGGYLQRIADNQ